MAPSQTETLVAPKFIHLSGIILIDNGIKLMLADRDNNRLRLLDLTTNMTTSFCTEIRGQSDGVMSTSTLTDPYPLMVVNDILYVGEYQRT